MSVRRGWIRLLNCSSWLPGDDVVGGREGSWGCLRFTLLYLDAKPFHVGAGGDGLASSLHL
jgi:hypothetical protein